MFCVSCEEFSAVLSRSSSGTRSPTEYRRGSRFNLTTEGPKDRWNRTSGADWTPMEQETRVPLSKGEEEGERVEICGGITDMAKREMRKTSFNRCSSKTLEKRTKKIS